MQLSAEPADCLCGTLTEMWEGFDFFDFVSLLFFLFLCSSLSRRPRRGEVRKVFFFFSGGVETMWLLCSSLALLALSSGLCDTLTPEQGEFPLPGI